MCITFGRQPVIYISRDTDRPYNSCVWADFWNFLPINGQFRPRIGEKKCQKAVSENNQRRIAEKSNWKNCKVAWLF